MDRVKLLKLEIAECQEYIRHYTQQVADNPGDWYYEEELEMYQERLKSKQSHLKQIEK